MPTPTTNLSFASIQTEFGGSNPISMSEYYKGGAYVPSGQTTSATDGTAIATSGSIRIGTFRGLTKYVAPSGAPLAGGSNIWYAWMEGSSGTVSASITFSSNGTVSYDNAGSGYGPFYWYSPTTTNIGASYWIRATVSGTSGSFVGSTNTWLSLSTSRGWSLQLSTNGNASRSVTFALATDSAGSNIVSTWSSNTFYVYRGILN